MTEKQETTKAWWPGSSLKKYTDALQELADRLKKESEAGLAADEDEGEVATALKNASEAILNRIPSQRQ